MFGQCSWLKLFCFVFTAREFTRANINFVRMKMREVFYDIRFAKLSVYVISKKPFERNSALHL